MAKYDHHQCPLQSPSAAATILCHISTDESHNTINDIFCYIPLASSYPSICYCAMFIILYTRMSDALVLLQLYDAHVAV